MKKKIVVLFAIIFIFLFFNVEVKAYTKEDIINISYNINTCSSKTSALVKGYRSSYIRLLNERNVSQKDLDKIYYDISSAIKILNNNKLCSTDQQNKVSESLKNELYNLYDDASELLVNSPLISTNKKVETKIVIDGSTNEIKLYQDGALVDVIQSVKKLNYVGLNKIVLISILVLSISLFALIAMYLKKANFVLKGFIYAIIFLLIELLFFKNQISMGLNLITSMKVEQKNISKEVIANGKKIISYPLYGDKYAKISIDNKSEDIRFGDSDDVLKKGIGQASSSVLPGENGITILSGHNTGLFSKLFNIKKNKNIVIETVYGKFTYSVQSSKVINDTDTAALDEKYDLILYTCYPNKLSLYDDRRIIVYAKLLKSEWLGDKNEK